MTQFSPSQAPAARFAAAFALGFAACESGPVRPIDAVDPRTYSTCQDPEGMAAWGRARAALARKDDSAALPDLQSCVERCPLFVRAHIAWQDAARRVGGDAERAMQAHYLGLPQGSSVVADYMRARLADTSYAQGNALADILRRDGSFAWAHLSLARVTRRQGRLLQALDMFAAAIVNDPELHEARLERAQVLAELGREEEAALDYRAYLRGVPDDLTAMHAYVTLLLYRLGRVDEAMALLDRLQQEQPGSLSLRMDRAAALWWARKPREAVEAYLRVLAEQPDCARAALNIGYLYYEVVPNDDASRRRFWPAARAAFRLFLQNTAPADGHEQFERTLAVPYRLAAIAELLGPDSGGQVLLDDLRWPEG
jgi:tetratricopeptide (TPR) repeat protein